MARIKKQQPSNRVIDPARFYMQIENSGYVTVYDSVEKKELLKKEQGHKFKDEYIYIGRAFFKYCLKIKAGKPTIDARTGIYLRKTDTVRAYDDAQANEQGRGALVYEGPAAGIGEDYTTGVIVWALNKNLELCRFTFSSSGLKQFMDFDKELENEPDFKVEVVKNPDFGPSSMLGKYIPQFEFADITAGDAENEAIEKAENALSDFFDLKGVGVVNPAPANIPADERPRPNFA